MGESLIQQYDVSEEGYFGRKTISSRFFKNRRNLIQLPFGFLLREILTRLEKEVLANFVPAAAVRRGGQVLFGMTRRKGYVDGKNIR